MAAAGEAGARKPSPDRGPAPQAMQAGAPCDVSQEEALQALQEVEEDDMVAMGLTIVIVKRALRLVTAFRSYLFLIRSGKQAAQDVEHIYMDIVPTIAAQPSFDINWDPTNEAKKGNERTLSAPLAAKLIHVLRQAIGLNHFLGFKHVVCDTDRIITELVQRPCSIGHFTISPKVLSPDLEDASPLDVAGCLRDLPRMTRAMHKATGQADFFVVLQNGVDAGQKHPHLNVQCIPCPERKKPVEITLIEGKEVSEESANKLAEALRDVTGKDVFDAAVGKPSHPTESAWQAPVMRRGVNPAGTSSPFVTRARSPHPQLEPWAKIRGINSDDDVTPSRRGTGISPFASSASRMLESSSGGRASGMGSRGGTGGQGRTNQDAIMRELAAFLETNHTQQSMAVFASAAEI
eukprot:CAMPEP_0206267346 /NCGR_PEP_ID=MMETSP0047_2-20121206/31100_1 /ASSEMBLY_ACC=CAM_ASM_000192 /TAXON_ID=195065 /ORGANISM="Chroomonas mesostigmatica_cf, Strain CCMP1168" /LENGTH=405 /DNA_ID=CAMNT_0053695543 /DNA_START=247 /DNA_END=1465 /DNA_ORIENTATION=-